MLKGRFLKNRLWFFLCGFILCAGSLFSQVRVQASLDSTAMLIGDQVQLHLRVKGASDTTGFQFEKSLIDTSAKVEWLKETAWQPLTESLFQKDLTFTVFDSGYYFFQPALLVIDKNGLRDSFYSNELLLAVNNPDTVRLEGIKPIIEEPVLFSDYLPYFYGFGLTLIIALAVFYFSRRKKKVKKVEVKITPKTPHEIALEKLETLKAAKYWQRGELKMYYSELTFILREYLENRYHFPALESTTDEILRDLKKTDMEGEMLPVARDIFQTADLVKFAKAQPPAEKHQDVMEDTFRLVLATKVREEFSESQDLQK
ncbi:MAG TPA: hypothetical protein PKC40_11305 [Saprospiraceae bacterium]|nr:hypothetical protein [Saprospiraceae bacterium]